MDAKLTAVADVLNAKSGKQKLAFKYLQELKVDTWTYDGQTYAGSGEQEVELKDGKQIQIHLVEDGGLCQARLMLKSCEWSFFNQCDRICRRLENSCR